ncbi:hypothetical protein [Maricaulis parjimensis]|uniref:hypothetical protein n=1 Tax=Maricaulis parjimensis TaxID=144023 RepID=UPI001939E0A6|nr:hypothetical protein [Maricaulis parjimensis]
MRVGYFRARTFDEPGFPGGRSGNVIELREMVPDSGDVVRQIIYLAPPEGDMTFFERWQRQGDGGLELTGTGYLFRTAD